ncbi:MAG: glycoside hydrolase family 99-like domain-containing protein [Candidatus Sulfobium sp.]|jgi:glycosyltransferase involved in cell wall biosynthesis
MSDKIRFVIIANPRTGTNHLIDLLNSHPHVTCHREVFHRDAVYLLEGTRTDLVGKRNQDPLAFLQELYDSSPTRACGFKIFMEHNDNVLQAVLRDRRIKKIVLYRSNPLAVYSSDKIAAAENRYLIMEKTRDRIDAGAKDGSRTKAKAAFDREKFELYWRAYQAHYSHVIDVLNETNQDYLFMTYEDYINESLFRRVFPFLGLSQPVELHTRMKKMNASDILSRFVNADEVRAYLNEIGKQNWAQEAFMLWARPAGARKAVDEAAMTSVRGSEQHKEIVRGPVSDSDEKKGAVERLKPALTAGERRQTLLFVDYAVPHYDMFAGSRTNLMYLTLLLKMGLDVKLLPADFRRVEPYSSELNQRGIETLDGEWYRDNWERWLRDNGREIDYVFFHKPDPAMKFLDAVKRYTSAAIIYQCHDLHYLRLQRNGQVKNDELILAKADLYEKKEDYIFSSSDVILTFSGVEEKMIREKFPDKQVFTVPLFFYEDVPAPCRDFGKRQDLLFVGGFAHTPNRDAVSWFSTEVLPLIRREIPKIVFNVVGADPPKDIMALRSKNVRILGRVSEAKLKELYDTVRLVVIPLRFGAGVKGKTVEALYYGAPVVSTSVGLEGIKGIDQICAAKDDPAGFAGQVVSLYGDEKKLAEISEQGVSFVAENFTSQKAAELMSDVLSSAGKEVAARISASSSARVKEETPRLIAFYLPQYHPIPENDEWWGKGFTEWRNVAKATPLFNGHYQPHIPADLGFYDLRLEDTRIAQAELAREYGIYGFCYYHYWFNGKRLLERPLNDMLKSGKPDFPFCVCWANENWTRRWDGEDRHILMKVEYSEEDDRRHIRELLTIFEDSRYIRINGKPLFLVYRTENIPDPRRTAEVWREEARKAGVGELYLVRVESIGKTDPRSIGFDAALEFAPDWNNKGFRVRANNKKLNGRLSDVEIPDDLCEKNYVHYYDELANNMMKKKSPDYTWFRCVTPSWDNTARRLEGAHIFLGSSPEKYQNWLRQAMDFTRDRLKGDENVVFVNAWNEWAEGNHLEPDRQFGKSYLEATRRALEGATFGLDGASITAAYDSPLPRFVDDGGRELFPELQKLLKDRRERIGRLEVRLAEKDRLLEKCEFRILDREARIRDLLDSASWRVTRPLRRTYDIMLKARGKSLD